MRKIRISLLGQGSDPRVSLTGRLGLRWTRIRPDPRKHYKGEALADKADPLTFANMSTIKPSPPSLASPQLPIARDAEHAGSSKPKPKKRHPMLALSAGCIAGGIEATAVWPMEYIKVRFAPPTTKAMFPIRLPCAATNLPDSPRRCASAMLRFHTPILKPRPCRLNCSCSPRRRECNFHTRG